MWEYYLLQGTTGQTCLFILLRISGSMFEGQLAESRRISMGLIVVDMQNGFVAKGGSYDRLGMNTPTYRAIIPRLKDLIGFCKSIDIPVFYTEAVREAMG